MKLINSMLESTPSSNLPELKKLSEYLTETESQLSAFWLISPGLKAVAKDGRFIKLNPTWTKVLGYSLAELMAVDYVEFIHPDDVKDTSEIERCLDDNYVVSNFRNRYKHKYEDRWVVIEWHAKKDLYSGLTYASGIDKTKEVQQELELQKALNEANLLRTAINSLPTL